MIIRARRLAALVLAGSFFGTSAGAVTPPAVWAPGEAALQARIVAPCCWNQTLDMHESELAAALRTEIHERLLAGETRDGIEDDLAARFGERVRAVPKGNDRRAYVGLVMISLIGLGGALAIGLLRRLRRRSDPAIPPELAPNGPRDAYDDRLDAELWALEGCRNIDLGPGPPTQGVGPRSGSARRGEGQSPPSVLSACVCRTAPARRPRCRPRGDTCAGTAALVCR